MYEVVLAYTSPLRARSWKQLDWSLHKSNNKFNNQIEPIEVFPNYGNKLIDDVKWNKLIILKSLSSQTN